MRHIAQLLSIVSLLTGLVAIGLPAQAENPTQDLLNLGRRAFDDLDYRGADSIARSALEIPGLRRSQRIQALELAAASRYPSGEADQHADSALLVLRALARIAPAAALPKEMTWHGLDSLFAVARRSTFGASVSYPDSTAIDGISGRVAINVVATRPATFTLRLARPDDPGLGEVLDSIGPTQRGSLRFSPVQGDQPRYPSGAYRLTVVASDPGSDDRIDLVLAGRFVTPPVVLQTAQHHDSSELRPERTAPSRARAIVSGLLVGAFAYAVGRAYRADAIKTAGVAPDSRAEGWGIGLGLSTIGLSWYLDRGRTIQPNVAYNRAVREKWAREVTDNNAANDQARVAYRGVVFLAMEDQ
ncbi:MAG: hypothetical protein ACREL5_07710 [Gemmatimonadales bacterium]